MINTKVTVLQNNKFIHEENIVEQLYSIEVIEKLLIDTGFRIIKCNKQIFNEEQRFKDKLYLIVEKI